LPRRQRLNLPQPDQHREHLPKLPRQAFVQRQDTIRPEWVEALALYRPGNLATLAPASGNDSDIARAVRDE